jgi:hypothetical protein
MGLQFKTISGGKYRFIVKSDLRNRVRNAGRENIVFVEGYADEVILEILYVNDLDKLCFIDISLGSDITGGCEEVKRHLTDCIQNLPNEKRFYGVIDRDLKTDQEVIDTSAQPRYDGRLFIFFERYTLENYFIELDILSEFLKRQSINFKKLRSFLKQDEFKKEFVEKIFQPSLEHLRCMAISNLTIRFFDKGQKFLAEKTPCDKVSSQIEDRLKKDNLTEHAIQEQFSKQEIESKLEEYKKEVNSVSEIHKFASAKKYFAYLFNKKVYEVTGVNIQLNNHKSELADILLKNAFPQEDFRDLLSLILQRQ